MSIALEPATGWSALFQAWQTLDAPDGWKAEIADEALRLTPPPADAHHNIADLVSRMLIMGLGEERGIYQRRGLRIPELASLYVPDLLVMPRDTPREQHGTVLAEHTLLVVEITSPGNADYDRRNKLAAYAYGRVPVYLLIDDHAPEGARCIVYAEPAKGEYRKTTITPFGEKVEIPEPIGLELDTSRFG
ncbi:Uma2 family endonuclease [Amycolatopsis pithecellobii]|uniref:Uma2 family endonuclease n=1 Tax=Amycolatopsis pithecellobii TaxID=664692 RepID=UPI00140B2322|nr:Uma2 family endonuclease [Amycolatopsis pithecellobii]